MQLPEPYQQQAQAGQPTPGKPADPVKEQARLIAAAVDEVLVEQATFHRDDAPLPAVGSAPPVPQPGRPPMSQRATDASALMLSGGAASLLVGGSASLVMLASGSADPVVCAVVLGAPAVLVLAIGRLVGRVKDTVEAAPAPVHNHFHRDVHQDQRSITTTTRGVIANTRTQTR
ncbi:MULTISPECIES: hypothetical protein [unclassified Streptomyces]|uniref:hypothetical protein n=1 Tax=unclassified Streptomyces TaxID=2593676 RepID=UPI002251EFDC|nr:MULTISPECIES: hypothetical protein [unclassified Streptomyces]MCX4863469.1 hypothetical protein [Streptomyces sp. NBC_00906]MCX4894707.1 hypothetical protein [Streptomyces sp. NBC_00892]